MNWFTLIVLLPLPAAVPPLAVTTCVVAPDPMVMESPVDTAAGRPDTVSWVGLVPLATLVTSAVVGVTVTGTLMRLAVSAGGFPGVGPTIWIDKKPSPGMTVP